MNKELQHEILCLKLNNLRNDWIICDRLPFAGVSRKRVFPKLRSIPRKKDFLSAVLLWTLSSTFFLELSEIFREASFQNRTVCCDNLASENFKRECLLYGAKYH